MDNNLKSNYKFALESKRGTLSDGHGAHARPGEGNYSPILSLYTLFF